MKAVSKNICIYNRNGFTLVEVLVAISLLLLGLVGPMAFLIRVGNATEVANQRAQATFLAQEGIELVQKVRDDAWVVWAAGNPPFDNASNPWGNITSQFNDCGDVGPTAGCALWLDDSGQVEIQSCSDSNGCRLRFNGSSSVRSRFNFSTGTETPFTRRVVVNVDGSEMNIQSIVTWRAGSLIATQRVQSVTRLVNIYEET